MEKENKKSKSDSLTERLDILKKENVSLKKRIGGFIVSNEKYKSDIERLNALLLEKDGIIAGLENQASTLSQKVAKSEALLVEWEDSYKHLHTAYMDFVEAPWYKRIFM